MTITAADLSIHYGLFLFSRRHGCGASVRCCLATWRPHFARDARFHFVWFSLLCRICLSLELEPRLVVHQNAPSTNSIHQVTASEAHQELWGRLSSWASPERLETIDAVRSSEPYGKNGVNFYRSTGSQPAPTMPAAITVTPAE